LATSTSTRPKRLDGHLDDTLRVLDHRDVADDCLDLHP
jgi:hypothetical protein